MKKYFVILLGVVVGMISLTTFASANEGPHGAYTITTEKCAGCHRPHTAAGNKLLKGDGVTVIVNNGIQDIAEFCFSCHKDGLGANNNVYGGVFMGMTGPTSPGGGTTADVTTNPWPGESTNTSNLGTKLAGLNGGGFVQTKSYWGSVDIDAAPASYDAQRQRLPYNGRTMRGVPWDDPATSYYLEGGLIANHFDHATEDPSAVTSLHNVLDDTKSWTVWGSLKDSTNNGPGMLVTLKCTSCHDQHGSRHYRILRDSRSNAKIEQLLEGGTGATWFDQTNEYGQVASQRYPSTTTPIQSWESEFNTGSFTKDYTSYSYKKNGAVTISDFCKTCHSQYYNDNAVAASTDPSLASFATYDAGDGLGRITRYRHFTEATMDRAPGGCGVSGSNLGTAGIGCAIPNMNKWVQLPVAAMSNVNASGQRNGVNVYIASLDATNDYMVCTTCHVAHGTESTTSSGSRVGPTTNANASGSTGDITITAGTITQTPTNLLRMDNRGVCEDCHGWTPAINELGQPCTDEYGFEVNTTNCEVAGSTSDIGMNN